MSRQRAKGTAAETAFVNYLKGKGLDAERLPLQGMFDKGDVRVRELSDYVFELKNVRSPRYAEWLREAETERVNAGTEYGVVIHKPHGTGLASTGQWHVVMDLDTFLRITSREGGPS